MEGSQDPVTIRVIYTGGTIGSAGAPLSPLPGPAFRALFERFALPVLAARLGALPAIDWVALAPAIDSTEAVPADWARIAGAVLAGGPRGGSIVLHGTDTLANTAAALDLLLIARDGGVATARLHEPVILTGSMLPLFDGEGLRHGTDALDNVETAFRAALNGTAGAHVAFGGRCLPGGHVLKSSSCALKAFASPEPAPAPRALLPAADPEALRATLDRLAPHLGRRAVPVIAPHPEATTLQGALLGSLIDGIGDRLGGLILSGYGSGNVPAAAAIGPLLDGLTARGVPIVLSTQVASGGVAPEAYAAGAWLAERGVIPGGQRTVPALHALVHLGLALAAAEGWGRGTLDEFLRREVACV